MVEPTLWPPWMAHMGRAVAEMGDDDTAVGVVRRHLVQPVLHIFVGKAMEAVAPDAPVIEVAR